MLCNCKYENKLIYPTSEGQYLYFINGTDNLFDCVVSEVKEQKAITNLILAGEDLDNTKAFEEKVQLNFEICSNLKLQLKIYKNFDNKIFELETSNDSLVIYTKHEMFLSTMFQNQ